MVFTQRTQSSEISASVETSKYTYVVHQQTKPIYMVAVNNINLRVCACFYSFENLFEKSIFNFSLVDFLKTVQI